MESKEHIEYEEYKEELDVFISQAKEGMLKKGASK